ncbi:tail fiber domain-containing protein, partial [Rhizobium bangladeshense]|uniref:tail fiber domain-containing protein n=1 Tax=Rhizobium bangladeshense TaxID=1138189 RepID=UPI000B25CD91
NSILTERNQPLNEISALMSGSQVNQPNYVNSPTTQLPTVDQAGLINENYNQKMGQYNQEVARSNAAMGGLFGLGSALLGGWAMSDRRLKQAVHRIGETASGLPVYEYEYLWGGGRQVGLMADEVETVAPGAVAVGPGGFKMVNYAGVL